MDQLLRNGQEVQTQAGLRCTVQRFLAAGGQGEVYQALLEQSPMALKWYYSQGAVQDDAQAKALTRLVKMGRPDGRFLWPMDLAISASPPGFGYVMPLREPRFKSIVDLMKGRIEPTFRAIATAGFHLAESYLNLHARGLCYRDISFGNAFLDPDGGEIRICDCDNVSVDGDPNIAVLGTPKFMAPEIVRRQAVPSTQTDLWSLAVLLFHFFCLGHPLDGKREADIKCLDAFAQERLYGGQPIFVFDPNDDSNRPVPGIHDSVLNYWPIYPGYLRDLFTRAFTAGIADATNGRVRESEWRQAMIRLRDNIVPCGACEAENFYDVDALKAAGGQPSTCWSPSCRQRLRLPFRIKIGSSIVMLNADTRLHVHHVDSAKLYDFSTLVGEVVRHPTDPNIWGLKNVSQEKWVTTSPDGAVNDVPPGKKVRLASGTKVNFGRADGEIRY